MQSIDAWIASTLGFFARNAVLGNMQDILSIGYKNGLGNFLTQLHSNQWDLYFILAMEDPNAQLSRRGVGMY
jgi:hypothetical protein